jgi:tetratricopeptide (TPR) repeat protein
MESNLETNAQKSSREEVKKEKKERFNWWQSLLLLVGTLVICLSAGYYISQKYFWNQDADQLAKQLSYYKAQVDQKPNDPQIRINFGYTYFLQGDTDKAIEQYNIAKNLDKKNESAYLNLAIAYDKEGDNDKALQNAIQCTKLAPDDYKGYLMEGRSYRKLKLYKKASNALEDAVRYQPGNTDILYEVGMVAEDQGNKTLAEKIYKETLSYDPTFKPAIAALDRISKKK